MTMPLDHSAFARAADRPVVPALGLCGGAGGSDTNADFPTPDFHAKFPRKRPATLAKRSRAARWRTWARTPGARMAALFACLMLVMTLYTSHSYGNPVAALMAYSGADSGEDADADQIRPMPFEKTGESFPGSAYYYLTTDDVAPGTLTPDAHWDSSEGALQTATPFGAGPAARAISVGSPIDRSRAITCLTTAIYYEAATEPDAGQQAVAQVILNRVAHPSFPKTVCDVVYQGSERPTGCQFTFTCDGSMLRQRPAALFWNRAEAVARAALAGFVYAPVGLATHYHTFAVHPVWDDKMDFVGQIGAHRFYRMMGPAGAAGAFRFAYAGREPMPGPHPRSAFALASAPADDPLAIERAFAAGLAQARTSASTSAPLNTSPVYAAPAYTPEVQHNGGDASYRAQNLPAAGLKPEFQASGQWINQPQ